MPMRTLWWMRWPLLCCGLFLLALGAAATALHAWLPPRPRWVVCGRFVPLGFAADGQTFRTATAATKERGLWPPDAPLCGWDVHTGREVYSLFGNATNLVCRFTDDGRRAVAITGGSLVQPGENLRYVDMATGRENQVAIPASARGWAINFSASGGLLLLEETDLPPHEDFENAPKRVQLLLFDTETLRLRRRREDAIRSGNGHRTVRRFSSMRGSKTASRCCGAFPATPRRSSCWTALSRGKASRRTAGHLLRRGLPVRTRKAPPCLSGTSLM